MRSTVGFVITTSYDENEAALLAQILSQTASSEIQDIPPTPAHSRFAQEMLTSMSEAQEEIDRLRQGLPLDNSQPVSAKGSRRR